MTLFTSKSVTIWYCNDAVYSKLITVYFVTRKWVTLFHIYIISPIIFAFNLSSSKEYIYFKWVFNLSVITYFTIYFWYLIFISNNKTYQVPTNHISNLTQTRFSGESRITRFNPKNVTKLQIRESLLWILYSDQGLLSTSGNFARMVPR